MENVFMIRENTRNVRNFQEISNENRETVKHGIETRLNRTQFFWETITSEYKLETCLHNLHCDKCVCWLRQNFQRNLGFS